MNRIQIRLDNFESIRDFHLWLKAECHFPDYYGCNLDALYDCLRENPSLEFEVLPSVKYEEYQATMVDTLIDAGCKVYFLFE